MRDGRVRTSNTFLYPHYRIIQDSGTFAGLAAGEAMELLVGTGESSVAQLRTRKAGDLVDRRPVPS